MLSFDFGPGYGFGNSKAYYGPQEFYADPGPSVDPTCGIRLSAGSTIARMITNTFKQWNNTDGVNWKAVSEETKEFYWEEFKKKYFWESFEESGIKDAWRSKAVHWNDPEVIQRSEIYSRNHRGAANTFGQSTHAGRSITYAEWFDKLEKELSRKPTPTKLFAHTHTRKHEKEIFVDQKSKEMHDSIVARREELTETTPDNIDENQLYLNVVRGEEKRWKVYSLGSESSTFYLLVGAS
ncbi:uncharacterized protein LOC110651423 [Hevea brasiliensis]|uniref:uncharacterized protein LOC110651423 n=1 Tax=Hevea brasiliensis TaxID=3981 RepID=UPI0025D7A2D3|nr:uncharacterized protein LOC110651423 [Hevea brasiliensis]